MHVSRYEDDGLNRLNTLELLTQNKGKEIYNGFPAFFESEYKKIRREWKGKIKTNNEALREFFNIYFGDLLKFLFDENGKIIYPKKF